MFFLGTSSAAASPDIFEAASVPTLEPEGVIARGVGGAVSAGVKPKLGVAVVEGLPKPPNPAKRDDGASLDVRRAGAAVPALEVEVVPNVIEVAGVVVVEEPKVSNLCFPSGLSLSPMASLEEESGLESHDELPDFGAALVVVRDVEVVAKAKSFLSSEDLLPKIEMASFSSDDLEVNGNGSEVTGVSGFLEVRKGAPNMEGGLESDGLRSTGFPPKVKPPLRTGSVGVNPLAGEVVAEGLVSVTGAGVEVAEDVVDGVVLPSKSFWISARTDLYRSRKTVISTKGSASMAFPITVRRDSLRPRNEV